MEPITIAISAAREAGKILLENLEKQKNVSQKENKNYNLITDIDLESEEKIISIIKQNFPEHKILSEETEKSEIGEGYIWIIDPLDGTNNYTHTFPVFSISIALYKNNEPVLGVIFDPLRNELFHAEKGKGSFLNNKSIKVTEVSNVKDSLIATGFYYDRGEIMRKTLEHMEKFLEMGALDIRRTGSAALDLCYVACGRLDAYWEQKLGKWDFAAGALIVMEAGGHVTGTFGQPFDLAHENVLATNGKNHFKILEVLKS